VHGKLSCLGVAAMFGTGSGGGGTDADDDGVGFGDLSSQLRYAHAPLASVEHANASNVPLLEAFFGLSALHGYPGRRSKRLRKAMGREVGAAADTDAVEAVAVTAAAEAAIAAAAAADSRGRGLIQADLTAACTAPPALQTALALSRAASLPAPLVVVDNCFDAFWDALADPVSGPVRRERWLAAQARVADAYWRSGEPAGKLGDAETFPAWRAARGGEHVGDGKVSPAKNMEEDRDDGAIVVLNVAVHVRSGDAAWVDRPLSEAFAKHAIEALRRLYNTPAHTPSAPRAASRERSDPGRGADRPQARRRIADDREGGGGGGGGHGGGIVRCRFWVHTNGRHPARLQRYLSSSPLSSSSAAAAVSGAAASRGGAGSEAAWWHSDVRVFGAGLDTRCVLRQFISADILVGSPSSLSHTAGLLRQVLSAPPLPRRAATAAATAAAAGPSTLAAPTAAATPTTPPAPAAPIAAAQPVLLCASAVPGGGGKLRLGDGSHAARTAAALGWVAVGNCNAPFSLQNAGLPLPQDLVAARRKEAQSHGGGGEFTCGAAFTVA